MTLAQKVRDFIDKHRLLSRGDRLLIAVSGGPDSVALLHILCDLRQELGLHLEVAHLQHGIRGAESREDAEFVRGLGERLSVAVHVKEISIPRLRSEAGRGNLEALARRERYRYFAELARCQNISRIVTAHTRNDQAETMLMWLLRGAGRKGLTGIAPLQEIHVSESGSSNRWTIVRPLLGTSKGEVLEFLAQGNFRYRLDRSNEDASYLRNWIRLELMPRLEERFDAHLPSRLAHSAEVLADEERVLDRLARDELEKIEVDSCLSGEKLSSRPRALQRRVLRLWIEEVRGHLRRLDFDHVEALIRLIAEGPPQSRMSIPGGWEVVKEYDRVRLVRGARSCAPICYSYALAAEGTTEVPEAGLRIRSRRLAAAECELPEDLWRAVFDLEALTGVLTLRNFRRGDRFRPLGMEGREKKVKDLFVDVKMPLSTRAVWPILVMGDEVLWLPGFGRSEAGRVQAATKEILSLEATLLPR